MNDQRRSTRETLAAEPIARGRTLVCPHPSKQVYVSKAAAKKALKRSSGKGRDLLHPYRCECGSWHVGHKPGSRKNHASQPRD